MKVLVTGGAGFIGSHVADELLAAGHQVVVLDNLHTGKKTNLPAGATFHQADLRDQPRLAEIFAAEQPDAISHQAALASVRDSMSDPATYAQVNVVGTLHLLELARAYGVKKIVFASTGGATYGEGYSEDGSKLPFTEESRAQPKDNYGANKLSCEFHLDLYRQNYGLEYVALRYPNVYGPRQDSKGEAGVVAIFAGAMLHNLPTKITGDGRQIRDFCYVNDIARANRLALESDASGIINVGTGVPTDINRVHAVLSIATGYTQAPVHVARPAGEVLATYLDSTKARQVLGWQAEVTLEDGMARTVAWLRGSTRL
ncbi:MAG: NAD-dependent epimerase/dehydratase family protein [Chloroflexi bacterium]|nr:NAD-dependent epimerase/dehydratase family protein [Chloroflexota bacterium]